VAIRFGKSASGAFSESVIIVVTGEKPELTNRIKNPNKNQEIREHFLTISRIIIHDNF